MECVGSHSEESINNPTTKNLVGRNLTARSPTTSNPIVKNGISRSLTARRLAVGVFPMGKYERRGRLDYNFPFGEFLPHGRQIVCSLMVTLTHTVRRPTPPSCRRFCCDDLHTRL
ncbi:hypothetical protein J6590_044449 [Homalodisca vitripennis]|nr:hypothetical protein J6590_044449 [Homalodisca vitripennis]